MIINEKQARRFILLKQQLLQKNSLKGKKGIYDFITSVGCIQFDPLQVIAMNPHLVLQARIDHYHQKDLYDLLYEDRLLVDGWDKNMSIFQSKDWPYFRRFYKDSYHDNALAKQVQPFLKQIKNHIYEYGPTSSKDLAIDDKIDWYWAPTKLSRAGLDHLFYTGELLVHHKIGTRKYYDLAERIIPDYYHLSDPNTLDNDYYDWAVLRRIKSIGLLWDKRSDAFLGIRNFNQKKRKMAFQRLLASGHIIKVTLENNPEDFYLAREDLDLLSDQKKYHRQVKFIAPLDNLMWDRNLIERLFNFKYRWEVYTPASKREYGYYVLPILFGDTFYGRFEPILDRKSNSLVIKNIWLDKNDEVFRKQYKIAITKFMKFLNVNNLVDLTEFGKD